MANQNLTLEEEFYMSSPAFASAISYAKQNFDEFAAKLGHGVKEVYDPYGPRVQKGNTIARISYQNPWDYESCGADEHDKDLPAAIVINIVEADTPENLMSVIDAMAEFYANKNPEIIRVIYDMDTLWHESEYGGDESINDVMNRLGFSHVADEYEIDVWVKPLH